MPDGTTATSNVDEREIIRMIGARTRDNPTRRGWRCPSAEEVAAYLEHRLAAPDKARLEAHLAHCDFCIGLIGSLVRQSKAEEQVEVPPHLLRGAIEAVPDTSSGRSWRWLLAPALATVIVASAVLLKSPQPAQFAQPNVPAPAVEKTTPPAPLSQLPPRPEKSRQVRSLKMPAADLQLLEPRSGSVVRGEALRFHWQAVAHVTYYEIRVVNAEGDPVWRAESTDPAAQIPGNVSLRPGKYFVWVRAHLNDGRTLKSETVAFRVRSSS